MSETAPAGENPVVEPEVRVWTEGSAGRLRLNRPKALNALTLDMVRLIDAALTRFLADPAVSVVILDGEGPKALCAGGDVRALYDSGKSGNGFARTFWFEEYRLNARIASYPKPFVAFMGGIVMGGGIGLSAHASHRVVTDTSGLAMPEVGIGLIPDVGGTWLLGHAPEHLGIALALTGDRFGAADAISAGFADLMIPNEQLPKVAEALSALPAGADAAAVSAVLEGFVATPAPGPYTQNAAAIATLFDADSVEAILAQLDADGSEFATKCAATIRKKCPTSLKLTLRATLAAQTLDSLEDALKTEFRIVLRIIEGTEFFEGVRTTLIDKGQTPAWNPPELSGLSDADLDPYFQALPPGGELSFG